MAVNISTLSLVRTLRNKLTVDPPPPQEKVLRILQKLTRLPISIEVLTETGIGKVVNGFRKHDGDIAQAARGLVRHWKSMVHEAMDEEAMKHEGAQEQQRQASSSDSTIHHKAMPRVETTTSSPSRGVTKARSSESLPKPKPLGSPETQVLKSPNQSAKPRLEPKLLDASPGSTSTRLVDSPKHKKQPRDDSLNDDKYTRLKEKQSSPSSGSPAKKLKNHHQHPENGMASGHSKRENDVSAEPTESRSSHGQKKPVKESELHVRLHDKSHAKSHDKSHDDRSPDKSNARSHDKSRDRSNDKSRGRSHESKATTKTSQSKPHSSASSAPHEQHLPSKVSKPSHPDKGLPSQRTEWESKSLKHEGSTSISKDKSPNKTSLPKPKSEVSPEKAAKQASVEKTVGKDSHSKSVQQRGKTDSKSKSVKVTSHGASSDNPSPKTSSLKKGHSSKSKGSSSGKREKPVDNHLPEELHDVEHEDLEGQDFRSTGMSFGDCLLVPPVVSKVKKVAKNKPSNSVKLGSSAAKPKYKTTRTTTLDSQSKVKRSSADTVKGESSRSSHKETDRVKDRNDVKPKERKATSSSEGQSSDGGHGSDVGRRNRKKRSISQEDEEAMAAKRLRRESADVAISLPEIQPDYKPMRQPEVGGSPLKKRVMTSEEERAFLGSKQGKTKVFSGRARVNRLTSVPKLYDMCMDILCKNIDALDEVGGVPFDILHPVLARCSPAQLFHLEDCNPHFLQDSDPLWQKHAQRDFKGEWPSEMESWRELYIRKHDEREARLKSITANISRQMAEKDPGRLTKMAFVDRPAKPPRSVMRQQLRHGTASGAFMPEKRTHSTVQPNKLSRVLINSSGADVSSVQHQRQARTTKIVAPMMMKTLRMIKKLRR
ncbi:uncharacterized protein [Asterias amurensis]|uniref:uncharacterized protein n=1 Tax=Asterias amurensis TaxID=7602 RepID=UPI003AB8BF1C